MELVDHSTTITRERSEVKKVETKTPAPAKSRPIPNLLRGLQAFCSSTSKQTPTTTNRRAHFHSSQNGEQVRPISEMSATIAYSHPSWSILVSIIFIAVFSGVSWIASPKGENQTYVLHDPRLRSCALRAPLNHQLVRYTARMRLT